MGINLAGKLVQSQNNQENVLRTGVHVRMNSVGESSWMDALVRSSLCQ